MKKVVLESGLKYKCRVTKPEHLKENALLKLWEVLEKDLKIDFFAGNTMMCLREQEEGRLDFELDEYIIYINLSGELHSLSDIAHSHASFVAHQDTEDYFTYDGYIIDEDVLFEYNICLKD